MKRFFLLAGMLLAASAARADDAANLLSPDKPLGAGFGVQVKERLVDSEDLDAIKDMGAHYLRFGFMWDYVESQKGAFDWSYADQFMQKLANRNFYAVYELGALNGNYGPLVDTLPNRPTGQGQQEIAAPTSSHAALVGFERYVAQSVKRYHGDHVIWEIWNEPDMNSNWPPHVDAKMFAKFISTTCAVIKRVDPSAVVVGPALAFLPAYNNNGNGNFLATILRSPAGACLDAISVHPYRHREQPPETVMKDYGALRAYIARHTVPGRKVLPIISSEWGYSLAEVTPEQQAAYAVRSFIINRLSGIPVSIWYEYRDSFQDDQTEIGKMDRESHFGVVDFYHDDKLSAEVLETILPRLQDSYLEKFFYLGDEKVYALLLRKAGGGHQLLFWRADSRNKDPAGLQVIDAGERKVYPVGLIPTLVCTEDDPPILSIIPSFINGGQEYYVPCRE